MRFFGVLGIFFALCLPSLSLDRTAFTFTKYDLQVRVEPAQHRMAVRGTITLRNDASAPQTNLCLQISSSLDWRSIQIAGKPVEFVSEPYLSDIDHTGALSEAIVKLPQEIQPKATIDLEVGYEGVVLLDATRLTHIGMPEEAAAGTDWDQIGKPFAAVRGVGHVAWYPIATPTAGLSLGNSVSETVGNWNQREADSSMQLELCAVKDASEVFTALMNSSTPQGAESTNADDSAGCREYLFAPLGRAIPWFAIGPLETVAQPGINIWVLPEHKAEAENYALNGEKVLPFVTGWFGPPREVAGFVELPYVGAAPFESGGILLTPIANIQSQEVEVTAVHQFTHAAFPSPRLWIYEGLAHFAQAAYKGRLDNRGEALRFMGNYLPAIVEAEESLVGRHVKAESGQSLIDTNIEEFYRSKAMYVWWMLRDMIGEPALKQGLVTYKADQDITPTYLQHLLEAQTKRDLGWFFDDWVYHDRGLPDFRIDSVFPSKTSQGSYLVTVTVENLGEAGAEVPVTVRSLSHEETQRLEIHAKSKSSVRIVVPEPPIEAVVNDGSVPESDMTNNSFTISKQ